MTFNILYVEDNHRHFALLEAEIEARNAGRSEPISLFRAQDPQELAARPLVLPDLVLADVTFPPRGEKRGRETVDRLDEIIAAVGSWQGHDPSGGDSQRERRGIPVIAYTGVGKVTLENCLKRGSKLYDIWDKTSAKPNYAAWRLGKLADELTSIRPDSRIRKLLGGLSGGAAWHAHVVEMARRYDQGFTERDQLVRAGLSIQFIADALAVPEICEALWNVMTDWEPMSRAANEKTRGHARHVLNVFWMGYYLLHSPALGDVFRAGWRTLRTRSGMEASGKWEELEALSASWFLASLFHDSAACLEKGHQVIDRLEALGRIFSISTERMVGSAGEPLGPGGMRALFEVQAAELAGTLQGAIGQVMHEEFLRSSAQGSVDHGIAAACHLWRVVGREPVRGLAREAARAMAIHNLLRALGSVEAKELSWQTEPVIALLILCDQLQTWDRERLDETSADDWPVRAELLDIAIEDAEAAGRPSVHIAIDYIAPAHVLRSEAHLEKVAGDLSAVILRHPFRNLRVIRSPWPFTVTVQCSLSGRPLVSGMEFGS